VPAVETKARQFIHLGYQRLLSFEVPRRRLRLVRRPPPPDADGYGLMEFADMAKVHDVDPQADERTRNWLLSSQAATAPGRTRAVC